MFDKSNTGKRNPIIAEFAAAFCRIWTFRFGLKGGGLLVRIVKRIYPDMHRFHLDYPGFGRCDIAFLDFKWLRQASYGPNEERALLHLIESLAVHYPVVWDIGANSGYIAVELALRLRPEKLILFEPNPEHNETLQALSSMDPRIRVFMNGLSDRSETAVLHIPGEPDSGSSCASLDTEIVGKCNRLHSVNVALETGDSLVDSGVVPPPNLIILDVEGHEEAVIAGLGNTIQLHHPIIVLEHLFLTDDSIGRLLPRGYCAYTVCDESGELFIGMNRSRGHNMLLVPEGTRIQPQTLT